MPRSKPLEAVLVGGTAGAGAGLNRLPDRRHVLQLLHGRRCSLAQVSGEGLQVAVPGVQATILVVGSRVWHGHARTHSTRPRRRPAHTRRRAEEPAAEQVRWENCRKGSSGGANMGKNNPAVALDAVTASGGNPSHLWYWPSQTGQPLLPSMRQQASGSPDGCVMCLPALEVPPERHHQRRAPAIAAGGWTSTGDDAWGGRAQAQRQDIDSHTPVLLG